jgi:tripartite-type tricarboxylate transporter receptor subunit TctC
MKRPRRQFLHLAAFGAALAILSATLSGHAARAQNTKTIKIVVALAPGGGVDLLARLLGEQIGRTHGLRMIIENRPGAGTAIGTEAVSRATPDGNTVLMMGNSFVINPNLKKLKYDPLSFEPVCYLATSPEVIVVNSASSYRTLTDLLGAARAAPNELSLASNGPAAAQHIAFEMLRLLAKVNMTYVPFPGTGPAMNALLGQHVTAVFADYPAAAEQLRAGTLRALATASLARISALPDVPTVAESGYEGYEAEVWYGLVAPAKTPKTVLSQLANWFITALQAPETKTKLLAQGYLPVGVCGDEFGAFLRQKYDEYGRVIRDANIKVE